MRQLRCIMAAAVIALMAWAQPAAAYALYRFEMTSANEPGVFAEGAIVLNDVAATNGLNFNFDQNNPQVDWQSLGVEDLYFNIGSGAYDVAVALNNLDNIVFTPATPCNLCRWKFALTADPGGDPTGTLAFNDSNGDFTLTLAGANSTGVFSTDAGGACWVGRHCQFTGTFTHIVFVPEPATLSLFAAGLLGLIGIRTRYRT